jgi:hypothetical protein
MLVQLRRDTRSPAHAFNRRMVYRVFESSGGGAPSCAPFASAACIAALVGGRPRWVVQPCLADLVVPLGSHLELFDHLVRS